MMQAQNDRMDMLVENIMMYMQAVRHPALAEVRMKITLPLRISSITVVSIPLLGWVYATRAHGLRISLHYNYVQLSVLYCRLQPAGR